MRTLNVETAVGVQKELIYNIEELACLGKLLNCQESKKRDHRGGYVNYLEIPCAFDIETTNVKEEAMNDFREIEVSEYIKSLKIRYTDDIKKDIADFEHLRRLYFNQVHLCKNKGSFIDIVYDELNSYRPDLFPDDIINQSDQLMRILEVYEKNKKVPKEKARAYAFMYHWQFCLDDQVVFGRTWSEFQRLLKRLEADMNLSYWNRLVIYCHHLPFEWQFMRRFVDIEEGFFMHAHEPLKVLLKGGIEFRCSAMLSNMTLAKFCENERGVTHYKLSGDDYDYDKFRTPSTPLTEYEQGYCYNDVRGLCECITSRLKDDTLSTIPYTSTGYVRRDARNMMRTNKRNRQKFKDQALTKELYELLRQAFRGGDTHANRKIVNRVLKEISSYDITSSYPASMIMDKYPMTAFRKITLETFYNLDFKEDAVLMEIRLVNPRYVGTCGIPYIPKSKCTYLSTKTVYEKGKKRGKKIRQYVEDNGRILRADELSIVCTEIDYEIIMNEYDYDEIYYNTDKLYAAKKDYLPQELRDCVMKYFRLKTELKGVKGKEYEYNKAKNMLNAIYGMMVMRIDQSEVEYINGMYVEKTPDLEEVLGKYYKSRNNFLSYQWGVWVTANSRYRLRKMLCEVGEDVCYCDTDSVKCKNDHKAQFDAMNEIIKQESIEHGAFATNKKTKKTYYIGTWDYEETYIKFKTLGSKKYLVYHTVYDDDGNASDVYESTIAGISKKLGAEYFEKNGFEAFSAGTEINPSGHLKAVYNDDDIHDIYINGERIQTASNLAIFNDKYTIGITDSYEYVIENWYKNIEDLEYV